MADGTLSSNFKEAAINPVEEAGMFAGLLRENQSWGATAQNASLAQPLIVPAAPAPQNQAIDQNQIPQATPSPMETVRAALEAKPAPKVECGKAFNSNVNPAQTSNQIKTTLQQTEAALAVVDNAQKAAQQGAQQNEMSPASSAGGGAMKTVAIGAASVAADMVLPGVGTIGGLACAAFTAAASGCGTLATHMQHTDVGMGAENTGYSTAPAPLTMDRFEDTSMTLCSMDRLVLPGKTMEAAARDIHQMHNHACAMRDNMARLGEEGIVIGVDAAAADLRAGVLDQNSAQVTAFDRVKVDVMRGMAM